MNPVRRGDILFAAMLIALAILLHGWITRPAPARFAPMQNGTGPPVVLDTNTGRVCMSVHDSKAADAVVRCWPEWEYVEPPAALEAPDTAKAKGRGGE